MLQGRRLEGGWARGSRTHAAQREVPDLGLRLEECGKIRIESVEKWEVLPFSVCTDVSKDLWRKGASRGNIHVKVRCLFSYADTSTSDTCNSELTTLVMRKSSTNHTLGSVKLTLSVLTSSRRAAGAFASDRGRRTERLAGRSPILR